MSQLQLEKLENVSDTLEFKRKKVKKGKKDKKSKNTERRVTENSVTNLDRVLIANMIEGSKDATPNSRYDINKDGFIDISPTPSARKINYGLAGMSARKPSSYRDSILSSGEDMFSDEQVRFVPELNLHKITSSRSNSMSTPNSPHLFSYLPTNDQLYIPPNTIAKANKVLEQMNANEANNGIQLNDSLAWDLTTTNKSLPRGTTPYYSPALDQNIGIVQRDDFLPLTRPIIDLPIGSQRDPLGLEMPDDIIASTSLPVNINLENNTDSGTVIKVPPQSSINRSSDPPRKSPSNYIPSSKSKRKNSKPQKRGVAVLKEIKQLQKSTHLLITKLAFQRLVKEVASNFAPGIRFQSCAIGLIQTAVETHLTDLYTDAYRCTTHAKRVTLLPKDLKLANRLLKKD